TLANTVVKLSNLLVPLHILHGTSANLVTATKIDSLVGKRRKLFERQFTYRARSSLGAVAGNEGADNRALSYANGTPTVRVHEPRNDRPNNIPPVVSVAQLGDDAVRYVVVAERRVVVAFVWERNKGGRLIYEISPG